MTVDVREVVAALEAAIENQRIYVVEDYPYEHGYLNGLERAADIVVIKAAGLRTGLETM